MEEMKEMLKRQLEKLNQLTESIARLQNVQHYSRPPRYGPLTCRGCNGVGGVKVPSFVGIGSMVPTVSESFYHQYFEP